jgi:hypothetical protein
MPEPQSVSDSDSDSDPSLKGIVIVMGIGFLRLAMIQIIAGILRGYLGLMEASAACLSVLTQTQLLLIWMKLQRTLRLAARLKAHLVWKFMTLDAQGTSPHIETQLITLSRYPQNHSELQTDRVLMPSE